MVYKPGESGNPEGRPKGALNKRTLVRTAIEEVFDDGEQGFWTAIAIQAKDGDSGALSMLAARLAPPYRPVSQPVVFDLPDGDLYAKAQGVLEAVSDGDIPPDIGTNLINAINTTARTMEIVELEKRITDLENGK